MRVRRSALIAVGSESVEVGNCEPCVKTIMLWQGTCESLERLVASREYSLTVVSMSGSVGICIRRVGR